MSPQDFAYTRQCPLETLVDRCDLQQRQELQDGSGGYTEDWATGYQSVPCRMAARRGTERFLAGKELVEGTWILTMGFGQQIVEADRVIHGGVFYEVIFVDSSKSYNTATRVLLKALE